MWIGVVLGLWIAFELGRIYEIERQIRELRHKTGD